MTAIAWASSGRDDSNATYQAWRDEFITKLGLLVTGTYLAADETNITPGAGNKPSTNSEQGYAVYHLADTMHSTAPVYIRFGFGTGSTASCPRIQITVGTTTNGSGVLGGTALTTIATCWGLNGSDITTDVFFQSFMSCNPGNLGIVWKLGLGNTVNANNYFSVTRSCDSSGVITATGAVVVMSNNGAGSGPTKVQMLRFAATAVAYTTNTIQSGASTCVYPGGQLTSLNSSGLPQALTCYMFNPNITPHFGFAGVLDNEAPFGSTFSVALVGATPRTYLALPYTCGGPGASWPTTGTTFPAYVKYAMLYE